ncbi:hypothetical protein GGR56DRAFT_688605 [Xylariaceae sp. FL0804]|nr:hypothetical protein GGR56DRAFT_688605 [Xylariaceae sp. FL0804]
MASFAQAVMRLVFTRKPREGRMDEEQAQRMAIRATATAAEAGAGGGAAAATVPPGPLRFPRCEVPSDDPLTLFRLMLGITTAPHLGFSQSSPVGTRPAANIGLYARVVHSEQTAKDSFKVFSAVINACYFLQIVVAAALTAMGAANSGRGAITAFGAINTVIAGFLTFLKGSGLPGRLRYYGDEWKKIREFIEQRERDFMRGTEYPLSVYDVVETVEKMYQNTKQDIELNTPDTYTSVVGARHMSEKSEGRVGGIDVARLEALASRLNNQNQGGSLPTDDGLEHAARAGLESDHRARLAARELRDREEAQARVAVADGERTARDTLANGRDRAVGAADDLAKELDDIRETAIGGGRAAAADQVRRLADRLSMGPHSAREDLYSGSEKIAS